MSRDQCLTESLHADINYTEQLYYKDLSFTKKNKTILYSWKKLYDNLLSLCFWYGVLSRNLCPVLQYNCRYMHHHFTLKNPITTTSSFSIIALAASTVSIVTHGGPVFFFNQLTMSGACLPPTNITCTNWIITRWEIIWEKKSTGTKFWSEYSCF